MYIPFVAVLESILNSKPLSLLNSNQFQYVEFDFVDVYIDRVSSQRYVMRTSRRELALTKNIQTNALNVEQLCHPVLHNVMQHSSCLDSLKGPS